jgi:uncharacterized membrane protein
MGSDSFVQYTIGLWPAANPNDGKNYYVTASSPENLSIFYKSVMTSGICDVQANTLSVPGLIALEPTPISSLGVAPFRISPQ